MKKQYKLFFLQTATQDRQFGEVSESLLKIIGEGYTIISAEGTGNGVIYILEPPSKPLQKPLEKASKHSENCASCKETNRLFQNL